jgi:hypothetical protein
MKQFLTSCFALCTPRFIILKVDEPATVQVLLMLQVDTCGR